MNILEIIKNTITQAAEGDYLKEPVASFLVKGFIDKAYKQESFDTIEQAIDYATSFSNTKITYRGDIICTP